MESENEEDIAIINKKEVFSEGTAPNEEEF
jgi:hypothetical protein